MAGGEPQGVQPAAVGGTRSRRWHFGTATLDESTFELQVEGQSVHLERKALEVLLFLLKHAGEVVTKGEVLENVWPGRILSESTLTRCISVLRQALKDPDKKLLRTAHGFGYRLDIKPEIRTVAATSASKLQLKAGDSPPLRPQWKLDRCLGRGGHGEAWLAIHDKTRDAKVFKFALDEGSLASLKREITLYRILHDSLPERSDFLHISEWNLEQVPYFLEIDYSAGGNLRQWAESRGGLASIPLIDRIELAARISDAVAAAHSVGVLHKDLKPSNILVDEPLADGAPSVRICDFGSGGVLDAERLDALGITRMGFTKSLTFDGNTAGTPIYLAPEITSGQRFTVKADLYALGVILYQLVTGDFSKPLAPGWEADIDDNVLREDILAAAVGDSNLRLSDAAELSQRLRTLAIRREKQKADAAAAERATREIKVRQELRRTRRFSAVVATLGALAIAGGVIAVKARNEAVAARTTATAITDFLMDDVLKIDPAVERPKDATYESLLDRAAATVDARIGEEPEAAAKIHWLLARRYHEAGHVTTAIKHYESAAMLFTEVYGRESDATLLALDRLAWIYGARNRPSEALSIAKEIEMEWAERLGEESLALIVLRARLAAISAFAGRFRESETVLRALLREIPNSHIKAEGRTFIEQWLGLALNTSTRDLSDADLVDLASAYVKLALASFVLAPHATNLREIETLARSGLNSFRRASGHAAELEAGAELTLAVALLLQGEFNEAQDTVELAQASYNKLFPPGHYVHGGWLMTLAALRVEQRVSDEGIRLAQLALEACWAELCSPQDRESANYYLGMAYLEGGRVDAAIRVLDSSAAALDRIHGPDFVWSARARIGLAEGLLADGRVKDAMAEIERVDAPNSLRPDSLYLAGFHRVNGLLLLESGRARAAVTAIRQAHTILNATLGPDHWRTNRVASEVKRAAAALPPSLQ